MAKHSITWLYAQNIHILVHNLFPCLPGPVSLSGCLNFNFPRLRNDLYCVEWDVKLYYTTPSLNFKKITFSSNHHHPFLKTRPCHRNLFLCTTFAMFVIPNCCLNSMQDNLSLNSQKTDIKSHTTYTHTLRFNGHFSR